MHGFWVFGYLSLRIGYRVEIRRLKKAVSTAETLADRQSLLERLEHKRVQYREVRRRSGWLIF